ncbi:MAG: hypothetical protein KF732_12615 [Flavobacteriales bacterium]|nr:hypothetical protein [Flavobacteriales bacterium]
MEDKALYNQHHFSDITSLIKSYKKILLLVGIVALIVSTIVSFLIKDKYKSSVILYPTTNSSISKAIISETNNGKDDVLKFGEIEEAEQLLQILHSDEIKKKIIEKYNLLNHYGIDENHRYKLTKLNEEFEDNVTFKLTKYLAIEIAVLDYNADTAALIANDIALYLDTVKNRMQKEIAVPAFKIVEQRYYAQKDFIKGLEDSLSALRMLGVIDYESQAERLTEQLGIAIVQGKTAAANQLEERLKTLSKYGGAYVSIRDQLEFEKKQLTAIHTKYQEAKVDAESILQHKFVVNNAFPAEKKTYPIRWLIVSISTLSSVVLALFLILIINNLKSLR